MAHDRDRFEIGLFCYTSADRATEQQTWPPVLKDAIVPLRDLDDAAAARRSPIGAPISSSISRVSRVVTGLASWRFPMRR